MRLAAPIGLVIAPSLGRSLAAGNGAPAPPGETGRVNALKAAIRIGGWRHRATD